MTLGEKIKEVRLSKKMTQNEVVGDFITRNMLSKIENNSATPSVKTVEYLANVLGVPLAYFMSSMVNSPLHEDYDFDVETDNLKVARRYYKNGQFNECVSILLESKKFSSEVKILLALAYYKLSEYQFNNKDYNLSSTYARNSIDNNSESIYYNLELHKQALIIILRSYKQIDKSIYDEALKEYKELLEQDSADDKYLSFMAEYSAENGNIEASDAFYKFIVDKADIFDVYNPLSVYTKALIKYNHNDYENAIKELKEGLKLSESSKISIDTKLLKYYYSLLEECNI